MLATNARKAEYKVGLCFLAAIVLFAFSNVFAPSGYANLIGYSEMGTLLSLPLFVIYMIRQHRYRRLLPTIVTFVTTVYLSCIIIAVIFHFRTISQWTNLATLFGIVMWIDLLSGIRWNPERFFYTGVAIGCLAIVLIYLFLPGKLLSGWNSNSSIFVIPLLLFGFSALYCSGKKRSTVLLIALVTSAVYLLSQLENRSSLMAVLLYLIVLLTHKIYRSKVLYRVFYLSVIALNVGFPFFRSQIVNSSFYQDVEGMFQSIIDKGSELNGREQLWDLALKRISDAGLFGSAGYRTAYYHNFALDVLTQFGWLGWAVFTAMLVAVFEKVFYKDSPFNLFPVAFICLLFMNTFENALLANTYFVLFPYLLLAVPLAIQRQRPPHVMNISR